MTSSLFWRLEKTVGTTLNHRHINDCMAMHSAHYCVLPELGHARVQQDFRHLVVYFWYAVGPADHLCWHVYIPSLGNAKIIGRQAWRLDQNLWPLNSIYFHWMQNMWTIIITSQFDEFLSAPYQVHVLWYAVSVVISDLCCK